MRAPGSFLLVAVIFVACPATGVCQDVTPTEITIGEIQANWTKRRDAFSSVNIEWKETVYFRKGSFDGPFSDNGPEPREDTAVDFTRSVLVAGGRLRTVDAGKYLSRGANGVREFLPAEIIRVWNGREARVLHKRGHGADSAIVSDDTEDAYRDAQLKPPMIACNLDVPHGIHLRSYRVVGSTRRNGGEILVLIKLRPWRVDKAETLWLKAEPPYLLVKALGDANGVQSSEHTWEYVKDPKHGWRPSAWEIAYRDAQQGGFSRVSKAEVTLFEVAPKLADDDFAITFPADARVTDRRR